MSGHSKWSTIKREKGAKDAKRGAIFTKLGNMIAIAARSGTDPDMNSSLALAIEKAKAANMPAANIQRAIDRVKDKDAAVLEEATYEAIGPEGVGIIIEVATDNKNRTFPEIKSLLTKSGAHLADGGSVMFQFKRQGVIIIKETGDEALLKALEAGAMDAFEEDGQMTVYTDSKDLAKVRQDAIKAGLTVLEADLQYVPNHMIEVSQPNKIEQLLNLLDELDNRDDVTGVYSNVDIIT